ncbi:MAG: Ribosomal large subunit pseudouridine synthase D [Fimbriimonadaceae bacterium]|nr:Ribosomal large subunit pseudouridine synthase D [Fimbriimonadaceae bacterium]
MTTEALHFYPDRPDRLDKFLASVMPEHSRTKLVAWIEAGSVTVDGRVRKPSFLVDSDMEIAVLEATVERPKPVEPVSIPLQVPYEDDDLMIVDKPRGVLSHPAPNSDAVSLVHALLARGGSLSQVGGAFRPGIVHRLDKDTTGLLVVAKNDFAHTRLSEQIRTKSALRVYLAVAEGEPPRDRWDVDAPLASNPANRSLRAVRHDGKPSLTHFRVLERQGSWNLLACRLSTGRTHQIRVHLAAIGMFVVGDRLYGPAVSGEEPLQLHGALLHVDQPRTGERIKCQTSPPPDFLMQNFKDLAALENW